MKLVAPVLALSLASAFASSARADSAFGRQTTSDVRGQVDGNATSPTGDGVYGRFDGDLDLGVGAGAAYLTGPGRFGFSGRLSAHYFAVAGVYVDYWDALDGGASTRRALGFGVDVRPLFIPRWSTNRQIGRPFVDLTLDSISLGLGAFFAQPNDESFGDERGFEASLGFGVPLLARADGPWLELRGALEWPNSSDVREKALLLLTFHFFTLSPFARAD